MKIDNLILLFQYWGYAVDPRESHNLERYIKEMVKRNRVLLISNDGEAEAILTFFITNNFNQLYRKPTWATPEEDADGTQIYVDKMVCRRVTLPLRRKLQDTIEELFPNIEAAYYHRAPYDRCIRINKRRSLCTA